MLLSVRAPHPALFERRRPRGLPKMFSNRYVDHPEMVPGCLPEFRKGRPQFRESGDGTYNVVIGHDPGPDNGKCNLCATSKFNHYKPAVFEQLDQSHTRALVRRILQISRTPMLT